MVRKVILVLSGATLTSYVGVTDLMVRIFSTDCVSRHVNVDTVADFRIGRLLARRNSREDQA